MSNPSNIVSSFVDTKKLAFVAATTFGVGCFAFAAWKKWSNIKTTHSNASGDKVKRHDSNKLLNLVMGQQYSAVGPKTFGTEFHRSATDEDTSCGDLENGNFHVDSSTTESQSLLKNNANGLNLTTKSKQISNNILNQFSPSDESQSNQHSFKRVVFRSRFNEEDGSEISTVQPIVVINKQPNSIKNNNNLVAESSFPTSKTPANNTTTRIDILSKVRGFSHEEYQNSLQNKLNSLYGTNKLITNDDAKCLVLLLQQKSDDTLLKTLTTMCNLAAFTVNQDLLRQNGAVEILVELLDDVRISDSVRLMLTQCIGNMAVNIKNHPLLQRCVPKIVEKFASPDCSELQKIMCVQALTNLSVEISSQNALLFFPVVPVILERLWSCTTGANVSSLKLLVNLSCSATLVHQILAANAPDNLFDILSANCSEDALIRSTTFFCHLCSTVDALNLKLNDFLSNSGDCSIEKSIYNVIFIKDNGETLIGILDPLLVYRNVEISQKAARILNHLRNIRDDLSTADDGTMVVDERQEGTVEFN